MFNKYVYKDYSVTIDIYQRIADVVARIAAAESISFADAYMQFANTQTYRALANPDTVMWYETAPFIVDEYRREKASLNQ